MPVALFGVGAWNPSMHRHLGIFCPSGDLKFDGGISFFNAEFPNRSLLRGKALHALTNIHEFGNGTITLHPSCVME